MRKENLKNKTTNRQQFLAVIVRRDISNQRRTIKKQNMRKIIAALNMSLDGFCDHTAGIPDEEIHQHYTELLGQGDAILYGRTTYQLMEFWRTLLENPSEEKSMNDFATAIDKIPKIVFSRTIENVEWESATIAKRDLKDEVLELKQQSGKDIFVGSRSLIIQLIKLDLIDEFQLCIHPVVVGSGLPLFENINNGISLKLLKTKTFGSGAVTLYYEPTRE
ncbi:MAG: dihydrofolate reductase family protein [Balneolales bacterium]